MKFTARNGETWRVRRRVTPWRRRLRGHIDVPDIGGGDDILGIIVLIIAIPFLVIAAIALSEFLLLLLLIPVYVMIRIAFRRPWYIDVSRGDDHVATESVIGWRAAGERVREAGRFIEANGRYGA